MAGWKLEHKINERVSFLQNFGHTDADSFQRNTYNMALLTDGQTLTRSAYFTDEKQNGFVVDNQFAFKLTTGGATHRLLAGAQYQKCSPATPSSRPPPSKLKWASNSSPPTAGRN